MTAPLARRAMNTAPDGPINPHVFPVSRRVVMNNVDTMQGGCYDQGGWDFGVEPRFPGVLLVRTGLSTIIQVILAPTSTFPH